MAEGLLRHLSSAQVEVHSAGTFATHVEPEAVAVMQELGINISAHRSKTLDGYVQDHFDIVITVCDAANKSCPVFPNSSQRWHWSIDDPSEVDEDQEGRLEAFRKARDELKVRIEMELIAYVLGSG